jgi:hypothetical protein
MPEASRSLAEALLRNTRMAEALSRVVSDTHRSMNPQRGLWGNDIASINDKVDKRNPHRVQITNPLINHRAFVWFWDFNPSLYFRIMVLQNLGRGTSKNAVECEFATVTLMSLAARLGILTIRP